MIDIVMNSRFALLIIILLLGAILSALYLNSLLTIYTLKKLKTEHSNYFFKWEFFKDGSLSFNGPDFPAASYRKGAQSQRDWKMNWDISDNSKLFSSGTNITYENRKINNDKMEMTECCNATVSWNESKSISRPLNLKQKAVALKSKRKVVARIKTKVTKKKCNDPFLSSLGELRKGFIGESVAGGLGNQMFAYASAYGIAAQLNRTLVIDLKSPLNKIFKLNATLVKKCVFRQALVTKEQKHSSFDGKLLKLKEEENYQLGPFLQSWRYFESVIPEVKKQFTFSPDVTSKAEYIMNAVAFSEFSDNTTYVGVHVRRGDIVIKPRFINFGYQAATKQYIENAMFYFTSNFTNVVFLICSDNMTWVKENIRRADVFYIEGNSKEVDMSILIHCNHTITTVGTFGWWAGFLAGGITLYYKYPAREGSVLRKQFSDDYSDHFYPGWIGME